MNQTPETPPPTPKRRAAAVLTWLTWLHLAAVLCLWGLLWFASDRWWAATALLFAPNWLAAVPLALMIPAAALLRRRLLWVMAFDLTLVAWLTGFNVPLSAVFGGAGGGKKLRVMTCNVHWSRLREDAQGGTVLADLIRESNPDVVALQGWSSTRYRKALFGDDGWHLGRAEEVALASRYPVVEVPAPSPDQFPKPGGFACFRVEAPTPFYVCTLHFASPRAGLDAVLQGGWDGAATMDLNSETRRQQSALVRRALGEVPGPFFLAGDFNTPPQSTLYREFWSPYANAFAQAGWGWGKTHFTRYNAVRIDHILAGPGWRCLSCRVGPDVGSPHRPVIADFEWDGGE
jgi:endonuclease/exonuclease/phosphatase (EEP) superfamily protein YafD